MGGVRRRADLKIEKEEGGRMKAAVFLLWLIRKSEKKKEGEKTDSPSSIQTLSRQGKGEGQEKTEMKKGRVEDDTPTSLARSWKKGRKKTQKRGRGKSAISAFFFQTRRKGKKMKRRKKKRATTTTTAFLEKREMGGRGRNREEGEKGGEKNA